MREDKYSEIRTKIDDEIGVLVKRLSDLRERRNSLAPIAFIPNEILSEIFVTAVEFFPTSQMASAKHFIQMLLSVSRHWRKIARETVRLWTRITNHNVQWALKCLELSKKAKIKVTIDVAYNEAADGFLDTTPTDPTSMDSVFFNAILSHFSRIQDLTMVNFQSAPEGLKTPGSWLLDPPPILQSWTLFHSCYPQGSLSADVISTLQVLNLHGCSIDWNVSLGSTLTSLFIAFPSQKVSVSRFGEIFRQLPALKWLKLLSAFMTELHDSDSYQSSRGVSGPYLQELTIREDLVALYSFLSVCYIPDGAMVYITPQVSPLGRVNLPNGLARLVAATERLHMTRRAIHKISFRSDIQGDGPLQPLNEDITANRVIRVTLKYLPLADDVNDDDGGPEGMDRSPALKNISKSITTFTLLEAEDPRPLLDAVAGSPLTPIALTHLHIGLTPLYSHASLLTIIESRFGTFAHVQKITIALEKNKLRALNTITWLQPLPRTLQTTPSFVGLEQLILLRVADGSARNDLREVYLPDSLESRIKHGCRLKTVKLVSSEVSDSIVKRLNEVVRVELGDDVIVYGSR